MGEIVSHHFLRRTARKRAKRLNPDPALTNLPSNRLPYYVRSARRGPFSWYVIKR